MQLIKNKVLVELTVPKETTESGVFIPVANRIENEGAILKIGPKVTLVAVGDKIRYYKGFGIPIDLEGKKCLFITEDEIELVL